MACKQIMTCLKKKKILELLGKSLCKQEEYCSSDSLEEEIRAGDVDALLFVLLEQETS